MSDDLAQRALVEQTLQALGIVYQAYDHPPVATAEAAKTHWSGIDAMHCKNLFLRNQKGTRHYLVVLVHEAGRSEERGRADRRRQIELRLARAADGASWADARIGFAVRTD